ncbi:FAD/NAD(P)-binding protein [Corynebacterium uterequi]|uniref:FAD-NAD(P)-binding n=1 Tax=Corynebacterium uterequi TaxID=1072256 RepID=A0A0G3HJQ3_9CORY|nr:FAD/NAD(P)-binding protein [Corynebacterium uterequi]AKK12148.1 FAD-NAD(P)-binding [Corynebacterium uterequi]
MPTTPAIAVIGLGPRGASTVERLSAQLNAAAGHPARLKLHLIDDAQHGGGRIWDVDQPQSLCMNTFAHGMTLFTEPGSTVGAPVVEGPTVYEWIRALLGDVEQLSDAKRDYLRRHPVDRSVFNSFPAEDLAAIQPASYLPRALYGHYVRWFFHSAVDSLPEWVHVTEHYARATAIADAGERDLITLDDSTEIHADATIIVPGWYHQADNEEQRWITAQLREHPQLTWLRPDNPIEQDVRSLSPGETVLSRGLGMSFIDSLILTTEERGGCFVDDPTHAWGLHYEASGREPRFLASSRRGYPFLPQSDDGGLPTPASLPRLDAAIAELSKRTAKASIDYSTEVWPAVLRDVYQAYVTTLAREAPEALRTPIEGIIDALDDATIDPHQPDYGISAVDAVITRLTTTQFSLLRWLRPLDVSFDSSEELTHYLVGRMIEDLTESEKGPESPVRAALWALGSAWKPTQVLGAEGRYTAESRRGVFTDAINLGALVASGPPLHRTRQLLALVDAGIVRFVGRNPQLSVDDGRWALSSPSSGETAHVGTALLDAWVAKPDYRREQADPLARSLTESGRLRPFTEVTSAGERWATCSPEQDPHSRRTITPSGEQDPRLHLVGLPAHTQYPDTALAPPIPGTDAWLLQETDKAAVSAIEVVSRLRA